jgi:hypothetical protein
MISHKHKFILITPQKTAATSICYALLKFADVKKIYDHGNGPDGWSAQGSDFYTFDYVDEFSKRSKHTSISQMNKRVNVKEYKLIGSIRNPYDRVVSQWKMCQRNKGRSDQEDFSSWLLSPRPKMGGYMMKDFFSCGGKVIVDNFIRFENLQEDFNAVCDKIGIPRQKLPTKNQTKHKHYAEYYDDESRKYVWKKFRRDINYFGYKFGE